MTEREIYLARLYLRPGGWRLTLLETYNMESFEDWALLTFDYSKPEGFELSLAAGKSNIPFFRRLQTKFINLLLCLSHYANTLWLLFLFALSANDPEETFGEWHQRIFNRPLESTIPRHDDPTHPTA